MIVYLIYLSNMYGCKAGTLFALRAIMKKSPFVLNFTLIVFSIIIFGQAIRISEAPLSRVTEEMNFSSFINSIWAVILTMTTVGYGDFYPRTMIGRFCMFLCSIIGIVNTSFMVVAVQTNLHMSELESKAFTVISKIRAKKEMRDKASTVIGRASKLYLKAKNNKSVPASKIFQFNKHIKLFKNQRR